MLPAHRTAARRIAAVAAVAAATACTNVSEPTAVLSPSEALMAKNSALTHPAGTLAERVPVSSLPWGIAVSPRGVVLTVLPFQNAIAGFTLGDPTAVRPPLAVSAYPMDVIFNRNGNLAYVAARFGGTIDVVDVRSNEVKGSIPLGQEIYRLALSAEETRIYATTLDGRLWTARTHGDPRATSVALTEPWASVQGKSLSPSGSDLYVAATNGMVWRLDPVTLEVRQSINLLFRQLQDIAAAPDGSTVWAADENGYVLKLDPVTLAPTATIDLTGSFGRPFGLAVSPDGERVYAASSASGRVFVIEETAPNTFGVTSLVTGGTPRRIAFGMSGAAAVVSNEGAWVDVIR